MEMTNLDLMVACWAGSLRRIGIESNEIGLQIFLRRSVFRGVFFSLQHWYWPKAGHMRDRSPCSSSSLHQSRRLPRKQHQTHHGKASNAALQLTPPLVLVCACPAAYSPTSVLCMVLALLNWVNEDTMLSGIYTKIRVSRKRKRMVFYTE